MASQFYLWLKIYPHHSLSHFTLLIITDGKNIKISQRGSCGILVCLSVGWLVGPYIYFGKKRVFWADVLWACSLGLELTVFISLIQVVRCCLEHAASVAKTFLMSDCVVVEIKEPEPVVAGNPMDNSGICILSICSSSPQKPPPIPPSPVGF